MAAERKTVSMPSVQTNLINALLAADMRDVMMWRQHSRANDDGSYSVCLIGSSTYMKAVEGVTYSLPVLGVASCTLPVDHMVGDKLSEEAQLLIRLCIIECHKDHKMNHALVESLIEKDPDNVTCVVNLPSSPIYSVKGQ
jgi:hypothetical protein